MTKDKKTPQEITDADLDQVQGGAGGKSGSSLTGDEVGLPSKFTPTPKNLERVHEDE